jgi:hypothetical protein
VLGLRGHNIQIQGCNIQGKHNIGSKLEKQWTKIRKKVDQNSEKVDQNSKNTARIKYTVHMQGREVEPQQQLLLPKK